MASEGKNLPRKGLGVTHYRWVDAKADLFNHIANFDGIQVVTLTPEMCVRAHEDDEFREIILNAAMVVADGVGVVWGQGRLTGRVPEKIPGIELAGAACDYLAMTKGRCFLLGGKPEVVKEAAGKLMILYPSIMVSGWQDGYFDASQEDEIVEKIASHKPHLVLVGTGSPKQEIFISNNLDKLNCAAAIGVGGSFDVWSGKVRRAPQAFRKTGLEWLYRTSTQPTSRAGRLRDLMRFTGMVLGRSIRAFGD